MRHPSWPTRTARALVLALAIAGASSSAPAPAASTSDCPPDSGYAQLIASEPGLLGYWRLGETAGSIACDVTGVNPGAYAGSVTLGTAGALKRDPDTAARFTDGGAVEVPHQPPLELNGAFTIELWVEPESLPATGSPGVIRKGHSERADGTGGWLIWYNRNSRVLTFKRQNVQLSLPAWQLGPVGTWSYIALTYSGAAANTLDFYVDGNSIGTLTGPAGGYVPLTSTDPVEIGRGDATLSDASVDEPAIYGEALAPDAIERHYLEGLALLDAPTPPTNVNVIAGASRATLTWSPSTDTDLAGYDVYRRNADGSWPATPLGTSPTTEYVDGTAGTGVLYSYRVTAYDAANHESLPSAAASSALPIGFQVRTLVQGLDQPTAVAWVPDGRMFVAEKQGILRVVGADGRLSPTPVLDFRAGVNSFADRGFLGLAADSNFAANGFLYLLYTVELDPSHPDGSAPMVSRLIRITIDASNRIIGPEKVLLGKYVAGPCPPASNTLDCLPSDSNTHSIGTIRVAPNGTLWVGSGDGASAAVVDDDAFRAYDEQSLAGKILHIDRSGRGLPKHAFCPSDANLTHVCTKLYARGFRNPFRFNIRPDTGPVVGDVGWNTREEVDLVAGAGLDFGWPCYEGLMHTPGYSDDARCAAEYAKEGTAGADVYPVYDYTHADAGGGAAVIGGLQYRGSTYPASYAGTVLFGDYVHGFVRRLTLDRSGDLAAVDDFMPRGWNGVDIEQGPDGDVVWVDPGRFGNGQGAIREWAYAPPGSNEPPVAVATATPAAGPPPLAVQFTGDPSSDPDGDPLSYSWDFGDGSAPHTSADPLHTYSSAGDYIAVLTVDDGFGHPSTDSVPIVATSNTPPVPAIAAPLDNFRYRDGKVIRLKGSATDAEDGSLPSSAFSWHVLLHHGTHLHDLGTFPGSSTSFDARDDHDADSYYEITLTVTDSGGLTAAKTVTIRPKTIRLTIASSPPGAPVTYAGVAYTAPVTLTAAIGFVTSVSAGNSFSNGSGAHTFGSWSDGGARLHTITVPGANAVLTAGYSG